MEEAKAIWAFEGEVQERGIIDWLKAHTSFMKPIHHYEGKIKLKKEFIELEGESTEDGEEFILEIPRKSVLNVNYGHDETYKRREDRSLGTTLQPLSIEYERDGNKSKIYLFVNFKRFPRTSDNEEWSTCLKEWMDEK